MPRIPSCLIVVLTISNQKRRISHMKMGNERVWVRTKDALVVRLAKDCPLRLQFCLDDIEWTGGYAGNEATSSTSWGVLCVDGKFCGKRSEGRTDHAVCGPSFLVLWHLSSPQSGVGCVVGCFPSDLPCSGGRCVVHLDPNPS